MDFLYFSMGMGRCLAAFGRWSSTNNNSNNDNNNNNNNDNDSDNDNDNDNNNDLQLVSITYMLPQSKTCFM